MARVIIFTSKDTDEIAERASRNATIQLWLDGKINLKTITIIKEKKPKMPYIA